MRSDHSPRILMSLVLLLTLVAGAFVLSACNTWHGAGKDVERTGEAMQHH